MRSLKSFVSLALISASFAIPLGATTRNVLAAPSADNGSLYFNNQGLSFGQDASMKRASTNSSPDFTFPQNRSFTLEAMIKPRSTISDNELAIFDFRNGSSDYDSQTRFVAKTSDGGATGRAVIWNPSTGEPSTSGTGITFGTWNHVAAVYDGTNNVKLYVNGVLQTSATWQPLTKSNVALYIGDDTHRYFDGWMNEVRIWNGTARTGAQIAANMNAEIDPYSPGLVAYYRFDNGSGSTISDITGRGHDATTTNSPTWSSADTTINNVELTSCSPIQSIVSGETVQTFTTAGGCAYTVPAGVTSVRALVVGGGGGGGADNGGGGGAGGYIHDTSYAVTPGASLTVAVGEGGYGGADALYPGMTGTHSAFSTLVAFGGGGGGSIDNTAGLDGGSAGGRAANRSQTAGASTTTSSPLQGNNGGAKNSGDFGGGGGGGASTAGGNGGAGRGGNGGDGRANDISGTNTYYAGGGGGGGNNNTAGTGGNGGGGAGSTIGSTSATAGTSHRGGGGGGGGGAVAGGLGARGGSGIVIIRYVVTAPSTTTTVAPTPTSVTTTTIAPVTSNPTPSLSTATTVKEVGQSAVATIPSTTSTSSTTTTISSQTPTPPSASVGDAAALINGNTIDATISRADNQLIISASTITAKLWVAESGGTRRNLDTDGNIRVLRGDSIHYEIVGLAPNSDATLWLFSDPLNLVSANADAQGVLAGSVVVPDDVPAGDHRFVTDGINANSESAVVAVGIAIGEMEKSSSNARTAAISVLILAILGALALPSVLKRRKLKV